jgi:O-acetyl-ADP-ribose deacetylase (regulator of RNase III)
LRELLSLLTFHGLGFVMASAILTKSMTVEVVEGNLLDQHVDAIVNAWNRNTIPWWLLLPQGVSGAIKKKGGTQPFRDLARHGRMKLGQAVATRPGTLPYQAIIHVAGINDLWRASEISIRESVNGTVQIALERNFQSVAFPIIGAGSGGFDTTSAEKIMTDELSRLEGDLRVRIVRFKR